MVFYYCVDIYFVRLLFWTISARRTLKQPKKNPRHIETFRLRFDEVLEGDEVRSAPAQQHEKAYSRQDVVVRPTDRGLQPPRVSTSDMSDKLVVAFRLRMSELLLVVLLNSASRAS